MIDLILAQALIYLSWIAIVMIFGIIIMYWCIFINEVWKKKGVSWILKITLTIVVFFIILALIIITTRVCNMTSEWVYTLIMK